MEMAICFPLYPLRLSFVKGWLVFGLFGLGGLKQGLGLPRGVVKGKQTGGFGAPESQLCTWGFAYPPQIDRLQGQV